MNHIENGFEGPEGASERVPPRGRFALDVLQFDLKAEATVLAHEQHASQLGHRQVALYKCDQVTAALFRFDKGGFLRQHKANGTVLIQVIEGALSLMVAGEKHKLCVGGLLVLAPEVMHDVHAEEQSVMLLTVCPIH